MTIHVPPQTIVAPPIQLRSYWLRSHDPFGENREGWVLAVDLVLVGNHVAPGLGYTIRQVFSGEAVLRRWVRSWAPPGRRSS